jgi:hypothetical protein
MHHLHSIEIPWKIFNFLDSREPKDPSITCSLFPSHLNESGSFPSAMKTFSTSFGSRPGASKIDTWVEKPVVAPQSLAKAMAT